MSNLNKTQMRIFRAEVLKEFVTELFAYRGVNKEDAAVLADSLVEADLRGVSSHGIMRCKAYCQRMANGQISAEDNAKIIQDNGAVAVMDGSDMFGAITGSRAMQIAIDKAKQYGIGMVCVQHSTHFGTCAYYAEMAANQDFIGIAGTNTVPLLPPMGGLEKKVGNNPIAFAVPADKHYPIILDMATSQVAMGKILLAAKEGRSIPLGWATDKDGNPTTDANAAREGFLLPAAGPKGLGLAIIIDLLAGALSGADFGGKVNDVTYNNEVKSNYGHFFIAIDPDHFLGKNDLKQKVDWYVEYFKNCAVADSVSEVYLPGEIEHKLKAERMEKGIPVANTIVDDLKELAESVGLSWKPYLGE